MYNRLGSCTQCGAYLCVRGQSVACPRCGLPVPNHPATLLDRPPLDLSREPEPGEAPVEQPDMSSLAGPAITVPESRPSRRRR